MFHVKQCVKTHKKRQKPTRDPQETYEKPKRNSRETHKTNPKNKARVAYFARLGRKNQPFAYLCINQAG